MRILLTNDDGINAPGLSVLEDIAKQIVGRYLDRGAGRRTIRQGPCDLADPSSARPQGGRQGVRHLPARRPIAFLLAVHDLMPDRPDLVLSGVNRGQNIAEDTSFSGTVAGAMFGMQMGIPSAALSQTQSFRDRDSLPWETARKWGAEALRPLIDHGWPEDAVMNINFPDVEPEDVRGIQVTRQGFRDESIIRTERREDLRGNDYYWIGYRGKAARKPDEGTDLRAIYEGYVSVSPLHVDLTHDSFLKISEGVMAELIADPFRAARLVLHLRQIGITDDAVLKAMETIDRGAFIDDPELLWLAFRGLCSCQSLAARSFRALA